MSATLRWEGMEELKRALRSLPHDLASEAAHAIEGTTNSAEQRLRAAYARHRQTGDLADAVESRFERTEFGAVGTVRNTSKLAYIFENGTQARHYITVRGNKHVTGAMPPAHVFIPTVIRERRRLTDVLKEIVRRAGLSVTGDE